MEPRIPTATSFSKPDLLALKHSTTHIVDVVICDGYRMECMYKLKADNYVSVGNATAISRYIREQSPVTRNIIHHPDIISKRELLYSTSAKRLTALGLTSLEISDHCVSTLHLTQQV
ncbi:unnamed protein product [Dicrocoelium dendriticum]|nr:unnamed protein product [Dicrocoelium dendriticum]